MVVVFEGGYNPEATSSTLVQCVKAVADPSASTLPWPDTTLSKAQHKSFIRQFQATLEVHAQYWNQVCAVPQLPETQRSRPSSRCSSVGWNHPPSPSLSVVTSGLRALELWSPVSSQASPSGLNLATRSAPQSPSMCLIPLPQSPGRGPLLFSPQAAVRRHRNAQLARQARVSPRFFPVDPRGVPLPTKPSNPARSKGKTRKRRRAQPDSKTKQKLPLGSVAQEGCTQDNRLYCVCRRRWTGEEEMIE